VGTLFAWFNYRSFWRQCAFVLASIAVAVLANWLRAYGIVMIAHFSDMKLALGVDHYIYGWVFFGIIIFLLMAIGGLWSDRGVEPAFVPPAVGNGNTAPQPLPAALLLATLALAAWPLLARAYSTQAPAAAPARSALEAAFDAPAVAPPALGWAPHYAGQSALEEGALAQRGRIVGWHLAWYGAQSQGAELINPANQLVREKYEPWRPKSRVTRPSGVDAVPEIIESQLRARAGGQLILAWQWYWVAGQPTTSQLRVKLRGAVSQLRGRGNAGAALLLYRVLEDDAELAQAREDLAAVLRKSAPELHRAFAERTAAR
jgi:EpsI family protein